MDNCSCDNNENTRSDQYRSTHNYNAIITGWGKDQATVGQKVPNISHGRAATHLKVWQNF